MPDENVTVRERYLEQMIESSSREGLVLLLVDGAVNFIRRAVIAHERERYDEINNFLIKAQNIYLELVLALDLDAGEFAENLGLVYQYIYNLLIEANIGKDIEKIKQGLSLAEKIRDLWKETIEKARLDDGIMSAVPAIAPELIGPVSLKKTGVYEPGGEAGIIRPGPAAEDVPSRLNVTG